MGVIEVVEEKGSFTCCDVCLLMPGKIIASSLYIRRPVRHYSISLIARMCCKLYSDEYFLMALYNLSCISVHHLKLYISGTMPVSRPQEFLNLVRLSSGIFP